MSDGAYARAHRRSLEDPEGFWAEAARGVDWVRRPRRVLDDDRPPFYRWFPDGQLNTCYNALDRHVVGGRADQPALHYDSPVTGSARTLTYAQLLEQVSRFGGALQALGVGKGDRVVIYMPMVPEAVVAMLACARIGAVHSVVFGGFAPAELAARIEDARPKVIVSASCGIEPSRVVEYKPMLDAAIERSSHVPEHCVILQREQATAAMGERDLDWATLMHPDATTGAGCVTVAATDPLYILYTSGTTGRPKGIVRDNGGHAVALTWSMRNIFGVAPGEVWWTASDVGWVVGHSYIVYAPLLAGCTTVLYEGKPVGTPDAGAFWRVVAQYGVSAMFTAPTAIRAVKKEDASGALMAGHDLSSLRTLFLAGERLDPDTYAWATERLGVPVIDNWWQTETGWPIAANPVGLQSLPIKPGSPTVPVPGLRRAGARRARRAGRPRRRGGDLPAAADAAGHAADPVGRRRAVRRVVPVGLRGPLPHRRRGLRRRGRLPVRHGPHRRRAQRRGAPAVDGVAGGRARGPPGGGRVRRDRGGRRAEGAGAARRSWCSSRGSTSAPTVPGRRCRPSWWRGCAPRWARSRPCARSTS